MKKTIYLILLFCIVLTATAMATKYTVTVSNFQFTPAAVTAQIGDTIVWNWSNGSHTTTSTSIPAGAASWDQPITSSNLSFSYKLTKAGTYNYLCTPHAPNMAVPLPCREALPVYRNSNQTLCCCFTRIPQPARSIST